MASLHAWQWGGQLTLAGAGLLCAVATVFLVGRGRRAALAWLTGLCAVAVPITWTLWLSIDWRL